ncbi:hypothetical protein OG331_51805 [Streptomyces sp. NBC_01017]|uniref:hypothetical protein n=1 Tax=Streptomyces sp. NBC_01017 TaxID=2903721 RepID=UPI003863B63D|nr:hypothetical protein OG331_00165 [Streptomyces sp. NBC_01017]WSV35380.1 hypothetical protein OG331_51805 [Streptomyces sp. NBC_01017]
MDRGPAPVGEVNVRGIVEAAPAADQIALLQLVSEHGGVLAVQLLFFDEPGDVDVVRGILLGLLIQPQQEPGQDRGAFAGVTAGHKASVGRRLRLDRRSPGRAL